MANLLRFRTRLGTCSSIALILNSSIIALLLFWSIILIILCTTCFIHSFPPPNPNNKIGDGAYHSEEVFRLNYREMETKFKIYIYPNDDGDGSYYDSAVGKYASEGYFFNNIRGSPFLTHDPNQAHLFFIPISLQKLRQNLPVSLNKLQQNKVSTNEKMTRITRKYVKSIALKYPYWNRTMGADHFFLTCLDDHERIDVPMLVKNTIRVVCSSAYNGDAALFIPHKDVTLPSVLQPYSKPASAGNDLHKRTKLGYWAGRLSSDTRKKLARLWGRDDELDIQNTTVRGRTVEKFFSAKFCLCPVGSTIANSRITMAIHYGCVPVILEDYLDLPFKDVLNWEKFAVVLKEDDVGRLKDVLNAKAGADYRIMYTNLIKVQKHFRWNTKPVKHDAFHMIMYELWLRRHSVRY